MEEANAGCSREEGFFSQFSTMISQRCPEFQRQWVPSGATEGGRELILSVSLHSPASLHYIISKRPCVPSYHLRQDCTRTLGVQLPLRTLSLSLLLFSLLFLPLSRPLFLPFTPFSRPDLYVFVQRTNFVHSAPCAFFFSYHYFYFRQKKKGPVDE